MKEIWLVTTDHLEKELWFRDDEDFKVGMNFVAIQSVCCPEVIVLAFILMSNHVHFVVVGTREEVEAFFHQFKRRYGVYFNARRALLPASAAWTICLPGRGNGCFIRTAARFLWIGI